MKRTALMMAGLLAVGCATPNAPKDNTRLSPVSSNPAAPAGGTAEIAPHPAPAPVTPTTAPAPVGNPAAATTVSAPSVVPTPAAAPIPPAPAVKDVIPAETVKDGKTYVFISVDAMTAFLNGTAQPTVVEKPSPSGSGKMIVIEAANDAEADRIFAGYKKLHPPIPLAAPEAPTTKPAN